MAKAPSSIARLLDDMEAIKNWSSTLEQVRNESADFFADIVLLLMKDQAFTQFNNTLGTEIENVNGGVIKTVMTLAKNTLPPIAFLQSLDIKNILL